MRRRKRKTIGQRLKEKKKDGQSGWGEKTLTKANSGGMMATNKAKGHDGKSNLPGSIQREGQLVEVAYVEGK